MPHTEKESPIMPPSIIEDTLAYTKKFADKNNITCSEESEKLVKAAIKETLLKISGLDIKIKAIAAAWFENELVYHLDDEKDDKHENEIISGMQTAIRAGIDAYKDLI
jgi:hypothetical protein